MTKHEMLNGMVVLAVSRTTVSLGINRCQIKSRSAHIRSLKLLFVMRRFLRLDLAYNTLAENNLAPFCWLSTTPSATSDSGQHFKAYNSLSCERSRSKSSSTYGKGISRMVRNRSSTCVVSLLSSKCSSIARK